MRKILTTLMVLVMLLCCFVPTVFADSDASEINAAADPTFTVVITASVDFGTINKSMPSQTEDFSVRVENAFIEDEDVITVKNVTADMNMYDNYGAGNNALAFALTQTGGLFEFDEAALSDGSETIVSTVTCDPADMQYAGVYRGYMTFEINYVDNVGYDILVDSAYTGTPGAVSGGAAQYSSVSAALAAANSGDKIMLEAGTYTGDIIIDQPLTIMGKGDATIMLDEFIVKAPNVTISNLKCDGGDRDQYCIRTEGLTYDDNDISGLTVDRVTFVNTNLGVILPAHNASDQNEEHSMDITIKNSRFTGCRSKGIYMEKGSNVVIENNVFIDCGNAPDGYIARFGTSLDINLKYGDYTNLTITGNTFTNCGNFVVDDSNGGAILLKARGTGNDTGYASNPASLTGIDISGNSFFKNRVGLSIGEPGKDNGAPVYDLMVFESVNTFGVDVDASIVADYVDFR